MKKQTLGMMIASLRKDSGMTQLELAEKMGVTDKAVSKWERDLSCPDVNTLPKLAALFEVTVDELMQMKLTHPPENPVQNMVRLVLKAIALAMGVGVVVLSALKSIDMYSGFTMLGIAVCCIGITLLQEQDEQK